MANWCRNDIQFEGEQKNIDRVQKVFQKMMDIEERTNQGQRFLLIEKNTDLNYLFDIVFDEGSENLSFETKWSPDPKQFIIIAQMFNVSFTYSAEEMGNNIYCEYKYNPEENILYDRELGGEDFENARVCENESHTKDMDECDEDKNCYYETDYEYLDDLLMDKEWNESEEVQMPTI
tara:strand:+ start:593 stop:1123 length:531 start_codon:yes stop_codon:yes gene_type:complete